MSNNVNNSVNETFKNTFGVNRPKAPEPEDTRQNVAKRQVPPAPKKTGVRTKTLGRLIQNALLFLSASATDGSYLHCNFCNSVIASCNLYAAHP